MAEIFLARVSGLPGFQKMVVIKRILPQLATQTDFVEMFLDEARIAATLQHPNVVQMYDVGAVKLLDFGIAKASNRFGETRFGTLKGKVPYMSPEQCRGEPLDRRSDIFSLGIMLYELTLGKRLYQGKSDFEVLKQIVEGTVTPPRELDPEYPPVLEAIVMRALDKEKD